MEAVLLIPIFAVVGGAIALAVGRSSRASGRRSAETLADAKADARRVVERLGGQVLNLTGFNEASKQALADASERYTAASSQIDQATTARQAELAKESALEGLYYVRAARTAMGMDPGPELETLTGPRSAGVVTEDRRVQFEGREIEASPVPNGPYAELLPRRTRRRAPGSRRLVLRAVVETRVGQPAPLGPWVGAVVRRVVHRDARRGLRRSGFRERLRRRLLGRLPSWAGRRCPGCRGLGRRRLRRRRLRRERLRRQRLRRRRLRSRSSR